MMTTADKVVATLGVIGWIYCALLWIGFARTRSHTSRRKQS